MLCLAVARICWQVEVSLQRRGWHLDVCMCAQLLCQNIMGLISSPLRIIVAMVMLYFELGFASLVALGVLLLLMPTQVRSCLALLMLVTSPALNLLLRMAIPGRYRALPVWSRV